MESKIVALGETVLDIIFKSGQPQAAKPGGSAFNSIISIGRTGLPAYFISEVGQDRVGGMIIEFLIDNGVDPRYVIRYPGSKSALALAFLNERNDAEYEFYKDYPRQRLGDDMPALESNDILLFGSFFALNPVLRPKVEDYLMQASKAGTLVVYDPNFRASHLDDLEKLKEVIEANFSFASIVRSSDEDLRNIYGAGNIDEAWEKVKPFCPVLIYTANADGVWLRTTKYKLFFEVEKLVPVSTIGAGDNFNAGLIYGLNKSGIKTKDLELVREKEWGRLIRQAISFSSEVCMSYDNYISRSFADMLINKPDF